MFKISRNMYFIGRRQLGLRVHQAEHIKVKFIGCLFTLAPEASRFGGEEHFRGQDIKNTFPIYSVIQFRFIFFRIIRWDSNNTRHI